LAIEKSCGASPDFFAPLTQGPFISTQEFSRESQCAFHPTGAASRWFILVVSDSHAIDGQKVFGVNTAAGRRIV
jgi:hypothetical protein